MKTEEECLHFFLIRGVYTALGKKLFSTSTTERGKVVCMI